MTRTVRAWLALGLAALWFAGPAGWLSETLHEVRAQELRSVSVGEPVQAVLLAADSELPRGEEAGRLADALERAVEVHELQGWWLEAAVGVLDEAQLERVAELARVGRLERSRSHPQTPGELLALVEVLSSQAGSVTSERPERPAHNPLARLSGEQVLVGLLALAEAGEVRDEQVPALLACALAGIEAHEEAEPRVDDVLALLPPEALAHLEGQPPLDRVRGFSEAAARAVDRLRARAAL